MSEELTIEVNSTSGEVKARTAGGAEATGLLSLDPLRRDTIRVFEDWLRKDQIRVRQELIVLGHHLYYALFSQGMPGKTSPADLLKTGLEVGKGKGPRLRLQLRFTEDNAGLIRLPWEFLYSPERKQFLATDVNLVLSRYIPLTVDREPLNPEKGQLRILIMVSRPSDQQEVIAKQVVQAIESLPGVEVRIVNKSTLDALETALEEFQPHVFHFIGHGTYDGESGGSLALVDPATGNTDPLDDVTLIECFEAKRVFPRLVFLHMCEGGKSEGDASALQAFSGFAPRLMHARIPAVVAMQYPIKNGDAQEFAVAFYRNIAAGGSIDEAVQQGRYSIGRSRKTRVFGTPVLYMHSCDGIILPPTAPSPSPDSSVSSAPASTPSQATPDSAGVGPIDEATAKTLEALSPARIDALIQIGVRQVRTLPDTALQSRVQVQLPGLRTQLIGKNASEVVTLLFDRWEGAEPGAKIVWQAMLDQVQTDLPSGVV